MDIQKVLHLYKEEEKKKPKLSGNYIISEKLDGWFTSISYSTLTGWDNVRSGYNRVIPSMLHAREYFEKLPKPHQDCTIIMEAYIPEMDFHTMNGIFNRSIGDCQCVDVEFYIHDIVYKNDNRTALERYNSLRGLNLHSFGQKINHHSILGISDDKKIWMKYFDEVTEGGGEGVILKLESGLYQAGKKNSSLMKIKLEDTFDLKCVDMYETTGEKGNPNLNLLLMDKSGVSVPIRVGKRTDINNFTALGNSPVGKVVTIKCMKKLEDGSYREPRFSHVRWDKEIGDID